MAEALAARLLARLAEIQRDFRVPQLALTGGRIATRAYQRLADEGAHSAVDWSRVELWWGDERFVPADDDDRNAKQALGPAGRAAAGWTPTACTRCRPATAVLDLDQAAEAYAVRPRVDGRSTSACSGMGPDGHVASIFPEHPSSYAEGEVIAVRSSPKPPPERISLTLPVINRSREVWFVVSGRGQGRRRQDGAARRRARSRCRPPGWPGVRAHPVADRPRRASQLPPRPAARRELCTQSRSASIR